MKPLLLAIFFLLAILAGSLATMNYISNEAEELNKQLLALESHIDSENWSQARSLYEDFNKRWNSVDHKWSMLINHYEIDNINMTLGELEAFIKEKDKVNSFAKLNNLKLLLKHIPDKEYPSLKNIL